VNDAGIYEYSPKHHDSDDRKRVLEKCILGLTRCHCGGCISVWRWTGANRYFTGPGGAGATVSDATAQMAIVAAVIIANASA
jgi:hypothetical protein